jgi:outer membrane protein OmpA-like peptidoglycan-associated protein
MLTGEIRHPIADFDLLDAGGAVALGALSDPNFPTGGHALDPKDQSQIHDVAGIMQSTPDFVATIIGKTDTVGSVDFNEHLSQRRVNAVFEALVYDNKVSEHRIQMCWSGERLPFISTADETAESQNRMVAIIITSPSRIPCMCLLGVLLDR